jgi:hypothetical protein
MTEPEPDAARQTEEDEAIQRRFAELIRRFWERPRNDNPQKQDNPS